MLNLMISVVALTLAAGGTGAEGAAMLQMEEANAAAVATVKQQMLSVAELRGIALRSDQITYATLGSAFIAHAALADSGTRSEAAFAEGVNISFLYVGGTGTSLPRGFYLVRTTIPLGALEGQAQFLDGAGNVVAVRPALVKTLAQEHEFLPDPNEPLGIPNITSTHIFMNGKQYVDCEGWDPWRRVYYQVA